MPLTDEGFKRRTYAEILEEMIADAKNEYGEDLNTSENSRIGKLLRIEARRISLLEEEQEDVYFSAYKNTATGVQLDRLSPYSGIKREPAQYAQGELTVNGTANYTVPTGFRVATANDVEFLTIADVTLDSNGEGTVPISAVETGEKGNVAAGTITEIINPDSDVTSVTNVDPTIGGREKETDFEFRDRMDVATEGIGKSTPSALVSSILNTEGVRAATLINNPTMTTDSYNTPAKAFQAFVLGGDNQAIFDTILENMPAGVEPYGTLTGTSTDLSGQEQDIGFSRAEEVSIFVNVTLTTNNAYPSDGAERIKNEIVRYVGGTDTNGGVYAGLNMGEDVVLSKIINRIYRIDGIDDVEVTLSTDGTTYDESNISIDIQQVAQCEAGEVSVNA